MKRERSSQGASHFRVLIHMTPKKDSILLLKTLVKIAQRSEGKTYKNSNPMPRYHLKASWHSSHRRRRAWNPPTSWYGSDDCRAQDHRPRCGSIFAILERKKLGSAGAGLDMKKVRRTKVEQIERIIIARVFCIMVTEICLPAPNQKGIVGDHGSMSVTWTGNISTCLQECRGETPC